MVIEHETIKKMSVTYRQLFKSNDPFMEVFTDKLPHRLLLCPTEGYFLTEEQYLALNKTVKAIGESTFFISEIEGEPKFSDKSCHWRINASTSYREYCQLPIYLENVIYSEAGNWGVIISHEEHALFGGNYYTTRLFKDNLPNWEKGKAQFIQKWEHNVKEYGSKVEWIPGLISHIEKKDFD